MTIRPVAALLAALLWSASPALAIERATRPAGSALARAEQLASAGKLEDAVEAFTDAIQDDPHNWKAFAGRAGIYARLQLSALAEADQDHAVEAAPDAFEPLQARAVDRFFKKRYPDAIRDLDAALRLAPDRADLYHWRGCAYAELNQAEKAIADFTQVIERDPEKTGYKGMELYNRGIAKDSLGQFEDALADYEKAATAGQETTTQRADCLLNLKRWKEAEEIYDDILRSTEESGAENEQKRYEALRERSVALAGQKLFDRSESDLSEAFTLRPNDLNAYGTASWTRLFAGKYAGAQAAALKALGINGNQLWIHLNLAHAYLLEGHLDWAKSIYLQDKDKRGSYNRTGAQIALQDLADLREAGIEHPDMAQAEAFLKGLAAAPPAAAATPTPTPTDKPAE